MRKHILALLGIATISLSACTPGQVDRWMDWHEDDPAAAEEFVDNGCNGLCTSGSTGQSDSGSDAPASPSSGVASSSGVWDELAECESGGDWGISTGNGYYGGLQFSLDSWQAVGGSGYPHEHSREEQIRRAEMLLDEQGWDAWPTCSAQLGLG